MADKKQKRPKITTPAGIAVWPKLHNPDTKYQDDGEYGVKLALDPNNDLHKAFLDRLDTMADEAFVEMKKDNAKFAKQMKRVTPYAPELGDDGEETGRVIVNFKMPAIIRNKEKTQEWVLKPALFDAVGTPLPSDVRIGGGSTIRVSFESWPYFSAKEKEAGITRRLVAVKVLNLKTWEGRDAKSYGFDEEEEGFTVSQPEAAETEDAGATTADF